jgi:histidinol phosphatase-like enzyme (inositol monophosphatase family)
LDDMKVFLRELAAAAAEQTLPRFRQPAEIGNKYEVGFDPVTEADREAERAIRAMIERHFPDHGIVGEEFGASNAGSDHVWVIDPIDGTRAFISGLPLWGTLVGLTRDGRAVAGMMSQPFTGETFLADAEGAIYDGPGGLRPLATRGTTRLADATLCTTTPALFTGARRQAYDRLEQQVRLARYGTDCFAYCMLAAGHIDLVVESGLKPYDIVALIPIIEGAGGIVTAWDGGSAAEGGRIVAAGDRRVHAAAVELLSR